MMKSGVKSGKVDQNKLDFPHGDSDEIMSDQANVSGNHVINMLDVEGNSDEDGAPSAGYVKVNNNNDYDTDDQVVDPYSDRDD